MERCGAVHTHKYTKEKIAISMTVSLNAIQRHLNRTALIIIAVISIRAIFDIVYRFPGIFLKCCALFFFHLISLIPNLLARVSTHLFVMIQMYIA